MSAAPPARAEEPVVALGKAHAASSTLQWEVRDAGHPLLGSIRFASLKNPITTAVGGAKVYSNVYVSCEKERRRIAIELTHGTKPDDPDGMQPKAMPRLTCNRLDEAKKLVQEEIGERWVANKSGDVLTRGLPPFPLRDCISIGILEEVVLPKGWADPTARVEFEFTPYAREIDAVFTACGEVSAYGPAGPQVAVAPPVAPAKPPPSAGRSAPQAAAKSAALASAPAPAPAAPAKTTEGGWREARTITSGHTNVRASPTLNSKIVAELDPGDVIAVRHAEGDWWHAKSRDGGRKFEGYIRKDRLVIK